MPRTLTSWGKGQSGNPAGRPIGARCKFSEQFYRDVYAEWEANGPAVLRRLAETDPATFVRVRAGLVGKIAEREPEPFEDMSDEELREALRSMLARLQDTEFGLHH